MSTPTEKPGSPSSHKYRRDIDGLRGISVLLVVAYHGFPETVRGGFIGVDVFFVISGFLITSILHESLQAQKFSFRDFYARRIKRIFPALICMMLGCFLFGSLVLFPDEIKQLGKHVGAGAAFVSNLVLWSESGYFDVAAENKVLLHLWSLGIEEQFYFIWPLFLYVSWRLRFDLFKACCCLLLISFAVSIALLFHDRVQAFYSPIPRFWELLVGAALALRTTDTIDREQTLLWRGVRSLAANSFVRTAQPFLGLSMIGIAALCLKQDSLFPGFAALLPTIGALLILAAGPNAWLNRNLLARSALVWIGLISYPLYLWHWPVFVFSKLVEPTYRSNNITLLLILASLALAWATYQWVEVPIRFGRKMRGSSFQVAKVPTLCGLMLMMAALGACAYTSPRFSLQNSEKLSDLDWSWDPVKSGYISCPDLKAGPPYIQKLSSIES